MEPPAKKSRQFEVGKLIDEGLLDDLLEMVNNPGYSDVEFICEDGIRIYACRLLLLRRSTSFRTMLTTGVTEFPLPNTSSCVLLCVFEFLYTGVVSHHKPSTWSGAFKVIDAARMFTLPVLEECMWEYLKECSLQIFCGGDVATAAERLSDSLEFKSPCDGQKAVILDTLVDTLESSYDDPHYVRYLSRTAFEYYMMESNIQCSHMSLRAYFRLHQLVLWASYKTSQDLVDKIPYWYLPDSMTAMHLLRSSSRFKEYRQGRPLPDELCLITRELLEKGPAQFPEMLSSMVNFMSIDPKLLVFVVMPLELIPPAVLTGVLVHHALFWSDAFKMRCTPGPQVCRWNHGSSDRDNRSSHSCFALVGNGLRFARGVTPMWPGEIYKWDITVAIKDDQIQDPSWYVEIGFIRNNMVRAGGTVILKSESTWKRDLSRQNGGWALRLFQQGIPTIKREGADKWERYPKLGAAQFKAWTEQIKFIIQFDTIKHICTFVVNNQFLGEAWSDLPDGVYFPAFSFNSQAETDVRVHARSGFNHDTALQISV